MAIEASTPVRSAFVLSRRLILALAVVFAILLAGMEALSAQATQPDSVSCPQVPGYEPPTEDTPIRNRFDGEWGIDCFYSPTNVDGDGLDLESSLSLNVIWLSELTQQDIEAEVTHPAGVATSRCSDEEFFGDGYGVLASGDRAVSATYEFSSPDLPYSAEAADTLRASVAAFAISCEGVEIIPRSSYLTPLPPYLADALADIDSTGPAEAVSTAPTDAPAVTGSPATTPPSTAIAAVPVPPGSDPATGIDSGSNTSKLVGFVLIGLSLIGLLWAFAMARKEHRVRPMFDVIRVALIGGAAVGSLVLLGDTPMWAVAAGVAGGAALGWIQGQNVAVRTAGKRTYDKRNVLAIVAFAVGLVLSQGAGR